MLREGTMLDGSIIAAPSSRKNSKGARDAETGQSRKGQQWRFGMRLPIGVDGQTGLAHSVVRTAANVHDLVSSERLLHGEEERVWGDAGYRGIEKRAGQQDRQVAWCMALGAGQRRKLAGGELEKLMEQCKAGVRTKVEHLFFYVKQMLGYSKTRY